MTTPTTPTLSRCRVRVGLLYDRLLSTTFIWASTHLYPHHTCISTQMYNKTGKKKTKLILREIHSKNNQNRTQINNNAGVRRG